MSHLEKASSELAANPPPALYSASTSTSQPQYYRKLGNPGPLGLFAFASTTFILSMYNVQTRGITTANVVVGMALFVGGLAQFVAGMWEFACQNTFGATAFTMFGGFWMSFGTIFIPGSGVLDAYVTNGVLDAAELNSALGIYLWTWFMITFLLFIGSLRKNIGLIALFLFLTTTFGLLGAGKFSKDNSVALTKGGGALGIITAMIAFYVGLAELLSDRSSSWFVLPLGQIPKGRVD